MAPRARARPAPRLDGDAVVAGRDVAAVAADVLAGVDVDAVAVPARAANGQIPDEDMLGVGRVD